MLQGCDGVRVLVAQPVHDLLARFKGVDFLWLLKRLRYWWSRTCPCLWLAGGLPCNCNSMIEKKQIQSFDLALTMSEVV